ncbi:MAG TPA: RagB/SusD family nutrient uptake outer membrane protein [Saprospiraceae bacterium]|nr:RagB/SusD family nutrient uptake outer membrane protein [Saprospiraceae bacterium]HRX29794.1 RagB/SusD family nutrient uptake outer membrane protein [Saprospiraceae bacterium]
MKKLYLIFPILILTFSRCTDLQELPEDASVDAEVFTTLDAYKSYLAKNYGAFSLTGQDGPAGNSDISIVSDEGFTSYIRAYWKAQELTTDEAVIAWTDAGIRDLHEMSWSSENQFVRVLYYRIALIVSISNDFLKQSSDDNMAAYGVPESDRPAIRAMRAEARFLRALAMWHAFDLFRNIPIVTEITADYPSQATPAETFAFIANELSEIESELPDPRMNQYGRADKGAVWMLQAKLYLNAEAMLGTAHWDDCLTACNKLLNAGYTLEPNYQELFMINNDQSNELIFTLPSDGTRSQSWGSTTFLVHAAIGGTMEPEEYGVGDGWAGLRTTSTMLSKFPDMTGDKDKRAIFYTDGQTEDIEDIGEFTNGIAVPKFRNTDILGNAGSNNTHVDTDYPMFRLADVYLMYAELAARNVSGADKSMAVILVNQLRGRAYGNSLGNISNSDLTLDFVLDERVRELYWEGGRRIDLIRFGKYTGDNYLWPWKGGESQGIGVSSFREIFPIPASDLASNPNLVQNTGY